MAVDLIVVGAGPAGAAAAISAARAGLGVVLLERGKLPRHRVCGEFVSPEGVALLGDLLGADSPVLVDAPRIERARIFVDGRVAEARLSPPARSITRHALDLALWRAAEAAGVDCRREVAADRVEATGQGASVRTSTGGLEAARVINASGRWSAIGRRQEAGPGGVGLKAHCSEAAPPRSVDLYFFEEGYCGVSPIGVDQVNVCALVRAGGPKSLPEVWRRSPELQRRSAGWEPLWRPLATAPLYFGTPRPLQGEVLCAGDAAGFVDPFVGDGISLALTTGVMAGTLRDPRAYAREYERRILPVFRAAAAFRALSLAPAGVRRMAMAALRVPLLASLAFRVTRPRIRRA